MNNESANEIPDEILYERCLQVRYYVSKGHLENAFKELRKLIEDLGENPHLNTVTLLESRYNQMRIDEQKGTSTKSEVLNRINNISHGVLNLLQDIDLHNIMKANQNKIEDLRIQIQRISASLSFNVEIARERIVKLGECWSKMYIFENRLFKVIDEFLEKLIDVKEVSSEATNYFNEFKLKKNLRNLHDLIRNEEIRKQLESGRIDLGYHNHLLKKMKKAFKEYEVADMVLEKNKFWLGNEIYEKARKYHDCYPVFLSNYKNKNYAGCLICLGDQKKALNSIEETIKKFQDKIFN